MTLNFLVLLKVAGNTASHFLYFSCFKWPLEKQRACSCSLPNFRARLIATTIYLIATSSSLILYLFTITNSYYRPLSIVSQESFLAFCNSSVLIFIFINYKPGAKLRLSV